MYESLMTIVERPPQLFVRGKGSWLWDDSDKCYLDFIQGWAVNCLGHCPKIITEKLQDQSSRLISPSPAFYNEPSIKLAELIVVNSSFDKVFFSNSGAEANEGAIKLARKWGSKHKDGAYEIVTFHNSFHGRTLATMSASGKPQFNDLFEPKVKGFSKAFLNDIESVKRYVNDKTVAVMVEPIQGEAGVIVAENSFMRELRDYTKSHNILLIVDEIQTGVGRTGKMWGYEWAGIEPDIMTLGKMLGGGVPLSALVATDEASCFDYGDQGGTYNGNPLMTAVGLGIIETVISKGFLTNVLESGKTLETGLKNLSKTYDLGEVRGRGLLLAFDLNQDIATKIVKTAFENGLLINAPRPNLLRFMPALNVTRDEITAMLERLEKVLVAVLSDQS